MEVRVKGRNPFLYSGHFNSCNLSSSLPLSLLVAIPSFIQGISTRLYSPAINL